VAGQYDATITQLAPVGSPAEAVSLSNLGAKDVFDALVTVEIGAAISNIAPNFELRVGVQNLSTLSVVGSGTLAAVRTTPAAPGRASAPRHHEPSGWRAVGNKGEVLKLLASYFLIAAGVSDESIPFSECFIVNN
jgi:hypothetical protein